MFKLKSNTTTKEDEQHNFIYEENEAKIKEFFPIESLNADTEGDRVLMCWNFNNTK